MSKSEQPAFIPKPKFIRLYRFFDYTGGLATLRDRRLRISRINDLNDPFEFLGVDLRDKQQRNAVKKMKDNLDKKSGIICFSKTWRNPLMWSHYADKHRGLCLGFDVRSDFDLVHEVRYRKARLQMPAEVSSEFVNHLLFRKFAHWSYEEEFRMFANLDKPLTDEKNVTHYYFEMDEHVILREVIIGSRAPIKSLRQAQDILGLLPNITKITFARPAFGFFKMVRNRQHAKILDILDEIVQSPQNTNQKNEIGKTT